MASVSTTMAESEKLKSEGQSMFAYSKGGGKKTPDMLQGYFFLTQLEHKLEYLNSSLFYWKKH